MKVGLLLRTLEHLRWEQLLYRPVRLVQTKVDQRLFQARWKAATGPSVLPGDPLVDALAGVIRTLPHLNPPLSQFSSRVADLRENTFTFLNRALTLDPVAWNKRHESHLWNYNLHYFNYSLWCARAYAQTGEQWPLIENQRLVKSWMDGATIGESDGWAPYPVSLRIVNWVYAFALSRKGNDPEFTRLWLSSIERQLDFLSGHLEFHLLANHLIKNAKALAIGGLLFGREEWIDRGRSLLLRELDEQVLPDGGHFERAPMYHAQVLADFLEAFVLLRACGEVDEDGFREVSRKLYGMARFLSVMTGPDGTLALFNDSANCEEYQPLPLLKSAEQVFGWRTDPTLDFPSSGYYAWKSSDLREQIVVDAGPPSAPYNTAHAHCDMLSYELTLNGRPFVVDSGVHGYDGDRFREYSRSTRAHNTVTIDGQEQSEIWATFRMGGRARIISASAEHNDHGWRFRGAYQPYFDRNLLHERLIERDVQGWLFSDQVSGRGSHELQSFIHLHPAIEAKRDGALIRCFSHGHEVVIEPFGVESFEIVRGSENPQQGWYFRDFGIAEPAPSICLRSQIKDEGRFGYRINVPQ